MKHEHANITRNQASAFPVTFKTKTATGNCGVCVIPALWRLRLEDVEHNTSLSYTAGPLFSPPPPHPKEVEGKGVKGKKENSRLESKEVQDNISHCSSQKPLLAFQIDNCVPGSGHRPWRMSRLVVVAITLWSRWHFYPPPHLAKGNWGTEKRSI